MKKCEETYNQLMTDLNVKILACILFIFFEMYSK